MKKIFSILALSLGLLGTAKAQQDLQLNVSNALFYEASGLYEIGLTENIGLGIMGGYIYGFPGATNYSNYGYFGPEFRYYVAPKRMVDRFYFGFYSRYKIGYTNGTLEESGLLKGSEDFMSFTTPQNVDYDKLTLGLTIGSKWVTRSGFVFGIYGGIGRNLFSNYHEGEVTSQFTDMFISDSNYEREYYRSSGIDSKYWDFRIGFTMGYRIVK